MQEWLTTLFLNHSIIVYGIIFLIAFAEGPFLSMLCGLLVHSIGIPIIPIYATLMIGDLVGDIFWYGLGHYAGRPFVQKFGKYFSITETGITKITEVFHGHKDWILVISKVSNGFGFALLILFTAGLVKIPFSRYMYLNFLGQFVWTGILLAIGYYTANAFTIVDTILAKSLVVAGFVVFFFLFLGYGKYLRSKIIDRQV